jgi:hypothetical protein
VPGVRPPLRRETAHAAHLRAALRPAAALAFALALTAPAAGQTTTTIWNSDGFESPSFTTGTIFNQQSFKVAPANPAGQIQTNVVHNGAQAFHINGPTMVTPGFSNTGANFWYRDDFNYNPGNAGTPYVQVQFSSRRTATGVLDMPAAGVYLEGRNTFGSSQLVAALMISSDGRLIAGTTGGNTGGSTGTVMTAAGQYGANTWHGLFAELNFGTQTYKVYRDGNPTPLLFETAVGTFIDEIPFRNSTGFNTLSIFEIGMLAYNFTTDGITYSAPQNHFYIDDFRVTASTTSLAPVPEPGLVLAVGAVGLTGLGLYQRRRL